MKTRKNISTTFAALAALLATAALTQGCTGLYSGDIEGTNFKFVIPEATIKGQGIFGGLLGTLGLVFPIEQAVPESTTTNNNIDAVYLNTLAVRVTAAADHNSDGSLKKERMFDENLVGTC